MPMSYAEAKEMMDRARNGKRKLENNTWLEEREIAVSGHPFAGSVWGNGGAETAGLAKESYHAAYAVRLHQTDVVTLHPDGSYALDSGGWRSVTTKDRINRYAPGSVASDKGSWYYYPRCGDWVTRYPFADGMTISPDGSVTGAGVDETSIRRELLKQIRAYVDGYAAHVVELGRLEEPGPGDCWGCLMVPAGEKPKGGKAPWGQDGVTKPGADHVMGMDHILSHFREKYYVPSLLWRAMQRSDNPSFCWAMTDSEVAHGDIRSLRDDLRAYLKKLTPALVAHIVAHGWPATED